MSTVYEKAPFLVLLPVEPRKAPDTDCLRSIDSTGGQRPSNAVIGSFAFVVDTALLLRQTLNGQSLLLYCLKGRSAIWQALAI
ncbi:nucleoprotein [Trichinella spiralis]|uniref:Nucleoprotein n=1 Tax=Trichinella spiralis TaxID=6334 RepID=A0ABR3KB45_TRISP